MSCLLHLVFNISYPMKTLIRSVFLVLFLITTAQYRAKATHIVGGDITVKSLGGNIFEVTLTLFFDCINGSPGAFDPFVNVGLFDLLTNAKLDSISIGLTDSVTLALGDSCFTPPNLCVRRQRYIDTMNIPNNVNGYYLTWHRCCRNGIITNIISPGTSGNVFYVEIPDPALQNSSPTFIAYPDAYMCINAANIDTFAATDIDGDSLVYSFSDPYDCATTGICSSAIPYPPAAPGPYGNVPWQAPYNGTNIMGDPLQDISDSTGIITTVPPTLGLYVFCVQVDEYRNGVKIGEVRRDVQYAVLTCNIVVAGIVGPNPVCLGNSTTLTATGGTSYIWNTGQTTTAIVLTPTASGTYTYVVTATKASCTDTAIMVFSVSPIPVVTATGAATVCPGQPASLTASGATTYVWSPSTGLNNPGISNPVATPGTTTNYTVTGTALGCSDTSTVQVTVYVPVPPVPGPAQTICTGANASLSASGATNYSWAPAGSLNNASIANPVASNVTATTTYTVTTVDANGCTAKATQLVAVSNPIANAGPNVTICMNASTTLSASSTPSAATYTWSPAAGLSNPNIANPMFTPTAPGTYTFTVSITTALGCVCSDPVTVAVNPLPTVFSTPLAIVCSGQTVTLSATGGTTYVWSPSTGLSNPNVSNPVANPAVTTTYIVTGTLNGCTDTAASIVLVGTDPVAGFTYTQSLSCDGISVQFLDASTNASTWYWNLGDGTTYASQNAPPHVFPYNGVYNITLLVTNPPCADSTSSTITIGDMTNLFSIKVPNIFSPNDDGLNDCFKPVFSSTSSSTDSLLVCTEMQVFDRWGVEIFRSEGGTEACWDGKTKSNTRAKDGTYYYLVTFGETVFKGHLTLIRAKK